MSASYVHIMHGREHCKYGFAQSALSPLLLQLSILHELRACRTILFSPLSH